MCGTIRGENLTPIGIELEFWQFFKYDQHDRVATALKGNVTQFTIYLFKSFRISSFYYGLVLTGELFRTSKKCIAFVTFLCVTGYLL
jgi:hypothetical protein